jgi:hypothetical protein
MPPSMLPQTATISRSSPVGTNGRTGMQQVYTNVRCLVMPTNRTTDIKEHFSLGKSHKIHFKAGQDVKASDQIVIAGITYVAKAIQSFPQAGVGHVVAYCEEEIN